MVYCGTGTYNYTSEACEGGEFYEAPDVSAIVIDFLGGFGVAIIAFVALIGLAVLYVWGKRQLARR